MNRYSNPSSIEPISDWMLTAYALNELEPPENLRVEQALAKSSSLRTELEQIRHTLGAVKSVLSDSHAAMSLDKKQTAIVADCIDKSSTLEPVSVVNTHAASMGTRPFYLRKRFAALLATAALVPLAAVVVPRFWLSDIDIAKNESTQRRTDIAMASDLADEHAGALSNEVTADRMPPVPESSIAPSAESPTSGVVVLNEDLLQDKVTKETAEGFDVQLAQSGQTRGLEVGQSGVAPPVSGQTPTRNVELGITSDGFGGAGYGGGTSRMGGTSGMGGMGGMRTGTAMGGGYGSDAGGYGGGYDMSQPRSKIQSTKSIDRFSDDVALVPNAPIQGRQLTRNELESGRESQRSRTVPVIDGASMDLEGKDASGLRELTDDLASNLSLGVPESSLHESLSDAKQLPEELRKNAPEAFRRRSIESPTGDRFEAIVETPFVSTSQSPLSTISIDVDTASYSKIRQYLMQSNAVPSPNMVRIEEMINYFEYDYAGPKEDVPFAAHMAVDRCPWNQSNRLVRIGLQARKVDMKERACANIVFLLDVSGSMNEPNKLPLVKKSLSMLASQLGENDKVAIVVYAGAAGCVLPSTSGANKQAILSSLEHLHAGGSTNGGQGIQLAYSIARENFVAGGINRVILCTDGDFNVGVTGDDALVEMMQHNAKSNVFLTCLGFGIGNYNDSMMEKISNKGNGVYGMIDNEIEARRMMVEQLSGTLVTVAKDVKIQVDFNPAHVAGYRLIGYEDRRLANRDFDDDRKDAGEIGAGHRVTALYEIVPVGRSIHPTQPLEGDSSKYQPTPKPESKPAEAQVPPQLNSEMLTLKVRYKQPEGNVSSKQEFVLMANQEHAVTDVDLQWASAVAEFGLLLRRSKMAPNASWTSMIERAESATKGDAYRLECVQMMRRARK
ncbi:MAG: von Willebrand factor type A domain-containing protein [Pirellula sp.]